MNKAPIENIEHSSKHVYLFYIATFLFIYLLYLGIPHSLQFLLISTGVLLFSFFAKQAINQLFG